MFGIEHSGVRPDLMTVAKSLAGGFPLSAVIGRADLMEAAEPGGPGGTYAGSHIACAAAPSVLDVINEQQLSEHADATGTRVAAHPPALPTREAMRPLGPTRGPGSRNQSTQRD